MKSDFITDSVEKPESEEFVERGLSVGLYFVHNFFKDHFMNLIVSPIVRFVGIQDVHDTFFVHFIDVRENFFMNLVGVVDLGEGIGIGVGDFVDSD